VNDCRDCRGKKLRYKEARCLGRYEKPIKDLIQLFKYKHRKGLSQLFAQLLLERYPDFLSQAEVVTFVPMPTLKLIKRGYNQSFLLARDLAKLLKRPLITSLQFNFRPAEQNKLSLNERRLNVKGAFKINPKSISSLSNQCVLLVDDVYTTGFTVQECCQTLSVAGTGSIFVITVARTIIK
jgi:ComF family protein